MSEGFFEVVTDRPFFANWLKRVRVPWENPLIIADFSGVRSKTQVSLGDRSFDFFVFGRLSQNSAVFGSCGSILIKVMFFWRARASRAL